MGRMIRRSYHKPGLDIPIICGSVWTGPVLRVGPGLEFTSINTALNAYALPIPLLILLYPGTYSQAGMTVERDVFIRGVGDCASIVLQYTDNSVGLFLKPRGFSLVENITVYRPSYTWKTSIRCEAVSGFTSFLMYNKCRFTTGADMYPVQGSSPNTFIIRNCYIQRGYAHLHGFNLSNIRLQQCQLNDALYCYQCTGSLIENDCVTAATIGYGPGYGSYFISGVDDPHF